ncbi:hypothetical protein EMCG_03979 [[Emmonsia] crescens]|uniref:Uncharacterized protein n=1 Tax=[Emmonsia] crescens TaxID=73230 RepID=A0A0G2HTI4_9EURO|nr:hypothetical protein EMCG_03979 [Emmonsia crescens UAMH 3008]
MITSYVFYAQKVNSIYWPDSYVRITHSTFHLRYIKEGCIASIVIPQSTSLNLILKPQGFPGIFFMKL